MDWVKTNCPSEIVESVRESSVDNMLEKFFRYVDDVVVDWNGEPVDWLIGTTAEPYLMTKFHSDGRDKLREAIVGRAIEAAKVLELE